MLLRLAVGALVLVSAAIGRQADSAPFVAPLAELTVLRPCGFEVSIPAGQQISLFAFHGKLNKPFNGRETGTWARDVVRARDGRLTFRNCETRLRDGDVLHFWTLVVRNGVGYHQDDGAFVVSESGVGHAVAEAPPSCSSAVHISGFEVPAAELKVLQPSGFEVSIAGERASVTCVTCWSASRIIKFCDRSEFAIKHAILSYSQKRYYSAISSNANYEIFTILLFALNLIK